MKPILFFILLLISALGIQAQTLKEYLRMAADSNPGLNARYAEFEAAMEKIPQFKSLPDPTLSVSAFGQMIETRVGPQRAIFILNQTFPWFGTLKAQGDAMSLFAEAKFQSWLDARNELFYKVKAAWYPLYELDQSIKYQQENKTILESFKTLSETRFKNGNGTMVDVIRVDIMMEDIITELKLLEDKRKPLLAQFNKLLNRETSSEVTVAGTLIPNDSLNEFSVDSMLQNNYRLAELDIRARAWKQQQRVAKKQGMPKLGVGLNYTVIGKRTDLTAAQAAMSVPDNGKDAIMPMISVSLPLFRKKYKAMVKESELMQTSAEQLRQEVINDLLTSYEMAWYDVAKAMDEYELFTAQMAKTRQATKLLLTGYSTSGKDFEEVLRMQQQLLKYEIATATATKNYYTAVAKLEYLTAKNQSE